MWRSKLVRTLGLARSQYASITRFSMHCFYAFSLIFACIATKSISASSPRLVDDPQLSCCASFPHIPCSVLLASRRYFERPLAHHATIELRVWVPLHTDLCVLIPSFAFFRSSCVDHRSFPLIAGSS